MPNSDPVRVGLLNTGESTTFLNVSPVPGTFNGNVLLSVGHDSVLARADGVHGFGMSQPHTLSGGAGVVGFGGAARGTGVIGVGSLNGVAGVGVFGAGGNLRSQPGDDGSQAFPAGPGVVGYGPSNSFDGKFNSPGVIGYSDGNDGIAGFSGVPWRSGVYGFNGEPKDVAFGVFGRTDSETGTGVAGFNAAGGQGVGVSAESKHIGFLGKAPTAAYLTGDVVVDGAVTVTGAKHAAVPFGDGTLRVLYSMESPESWFEDFAEGTLKRGKATVKIAGDFLRCIRRGVFHVFLTPLADCKGLYVHRRSAGAFEVRELGGGTSTLKFSYRVVAKRKDVAGKRLEKVALPELPFSDKLFRGETASSKARYKKQMSDLTAIGADCVKQRHTGPEPKASKRRKAPSAPGSSKRG